MVLSPKAIKRIKQAVQNYANFLKFSTIGPQVLTIPELKELARSGYIGRAKNPKTAIADAYLSAHIDLSHKPAGAPRTIREGSLSFLERMASMYTDKMANDLGTDIMASLEAHFLPFANRKEGEQVYEMLKDPANHGKYLGNMLVGKVKNWEHRHQTIVKTETHRAAAWGAADAILANNPKKTADEIYIFFTGPNAGDSNTCKHCVKHYFLADGITPRVYLLSDLLANGTNIGKKAADWHACVEPMHPNCRHLPHELKPGYGFKAGKLEYIGESHIEYVSQKRQ